MLDKLTSRMTYLFTHRNSKQFTFLSGTMNDGRNACRWMGTVWREMGIEKVVNNQHRRVRCTHAALN